MADDEERHAWERSGTFEVAPGVFRIPLPLPNDGLKAVNVYAVADGDQVVLVDGGWAMGDAQSRLADGLAEIGYGLGDVRDFYVTHLHRDHYTQAVAVRRTYGNRVSLGEGERVCLDLIRQGARGGDVPGLKAAGAPELARQVAEWIDATDDLDLDDWGYPDTWLQDAVDLPLQTRTLRAIHTPGHTRGHLVYHDAAHQVLFAGDHVLPHITPSIGIEASRPPSPLRDYLASLQLVRAMPDAVLLPAHGPVTGSVHARIDELLTHHEDRLTVTAEAIDHGAQTGLEAARSITWTRHKRSFRDLDMWNQVMATQETMAHLQVLVERGWLTETTVDGVARFARA